jgi:hypothetical protein
MRTRMKMRKDEEEYIRDKHADEDENEDEKDNEACQTCVGAGGPFRGRFDIYSV